MDGLGQDNVDPAVSRPLIAIPARFAAHTSALRYAAEVAARALVEAVYRAGGEPWVMHPARDEVHERLARCDGLLLPGGGDVDPRRYGEAATARNLYDVDDELDAFDLAAARHALATGLPTLAICRGMEVVNVGLGGTLRQDLPDHRPRTHSVVVDPASRLAAVYAAKKVEVSCHHHQGVARLGDGLRAVAWSEDGIVEAVELEAAQGWFAAVQWHPEDTAAHQRLFDAFVLSGRSRASTSAAPGHGLGAGE
jgi:putative glutamine amidotransferase